MKVLDQGDHCTIELRVTPGSKRFQIGLRGDGVVLVKVPAKAVDGAANKALVKGFARAVGLKRRQVRLLRGERSKDKVLAAECTRDELIAALARQIE